MFSCLSSFINEISRIAVDGVPSSESRCISFSATSSPVCRFRPLKTWRVSRTFRGGNEGPLLWRKCLRRAENVSMTSHVVLGLASLAFSSCWNELGWRLSISCKLARLQDCGLGFCVNRTELGETSCSAISSVCRETSINLFPQPCSDRRVCIRLLIGEAALLNQLP